MSPSKVDVTNVREVVISGAGVGLPGKGKEIFDENNIQRLLTGENFISRIGDQKIRLQKRQNIIQKQKQKGKIVYKQLQKEKELVKLAGEAGTFDLVKEYGVGNGLIDAWEITTQLAIAAGLEALKDAYIPLVETAGKLSLPDDMSSTTGIIFASTFPSANTFLQEQSKLYNHLHFLEKKKIASELQMKFGDDAEDIISTMFSDSDVKYQFDRKYLLKAIPIQSGNFAQVINAKGPNTVINAACASTTQAIAIAADWIKLGRCDRVIVVAADDPTNETTFGWIATGFLAAGAATTEKNVDQAAKPFDQKRSGMILGMGAVGIVLETKEEADKRGVIPIAKLMGSYFANSAYHGTRMDPHHVKTSFKKFMKQIVNQYDLSLKQICKNMLYMSHETFTPSKGNAAKTEIGALEAVFGEGIKNILIANTKGLTAHPMGVSIEDVATIKSLELSKTPPVVNLTMPEFENLNFSIGDPVNIDYAIRFAAGFGSQLVYLLLKNYHTKRRVTDRFEKWLEDLGLNKNLEKRGKTLIVKAIVS